MDKSSIKVHTDERINGIILELENNSSAPSYRTAELVNSAEFLDYCKNDKIAKTDDLDAINKNVLRRLIKNYRNTHAFNVNYTSKVSSISGLYNFRNQKAFDDSIGWAADQIAWYNRLTTPEQKKSDNYINYLINCTRQYLREELAMRAAKYGGNENMTLNELYELIEEKGTEQDINLKDFVQTAHEEADFWRDAFYNGKISAIGRDYEFENENLADSTSNEEDEDDIRDSDQADETDQSTKQWNMDGAIQSYTKLLSADIKDYFNTLQKLNSTERYDEDGYDVDLSNSIGLPVCHTYQECSIELFNAVNNMGGFTSLQDFISVVEMIAEQKKEFASFRVLADDMKEDSDFANKVYTELNKYVTDNIEINVNQNGGIVSVQSNNNNNPVRKIYFELRNDLKGTAVQNDNISLEADIEALATQINNYNRLSSVEEFNDPRAGAKEAFIAQKQQIFDNIVRELKAAYKMYFPKLNELSIDSYITRGEGSQADKLNNLVTYLERVNRAAKLTFIEKANRDTAARQVYFENKATREAYQLAKDLGQKPGKLILKEVPRYNDEYIRGADEVLNNVALALEPFTYSKVELNSRTVDNKLSSDVLYNNFLTNLDKVSKSKETLELWAKENLKSTEYTYSNILIDRPDLGIIGLFRDKGNGEYEVTKHATQIINLYKLNGNRNLQTGTNAKYTNMSDGDYFLTMMYAFKKDVKSYKKYNVAGGNNIKLVSTAPFMMKTPSDAPKNFMVTLPKYSTDGLWNYDKNEINKYFREEVAKITRTANIPEGVMKMTPAFSTIVPVDRALELIVNTPDKIGVGNANLLNFKAKLGEENVIAINFTEEGSGFYYYFKGVVVKEGTKQFMINPQYIGERNENAASVSFNSRLNVVLEERFKNEHPEARQLNKQHPIFNSIMNMLKGEVFDYLKAREDVKNWSKEELIEWFHYDPRVGVRDKNGNLTGNAFKFTRLDDKAGVDVNKLMQEVITTFHSTGGRQLTAYSKDSTAQARLEFQADEVAMIENIAEQWLSGFEAYSVADVHAKFGSFLEGITNDDIKELALNSYIANVSFLDLFEGNDKYYKDAQTFLKRTKEAQAGGISYSLASFRATDYNTNSPFTQAVNKIPNSNIQINGTDIMVNGKPLTMRTGWNGVVIKNTVRPSSRKNALYEQLINSGSTVAKATELASGFGYTPDNIGEGETTKVNDAQSYITIYEAIRRIKALGDFLKYEGLIEQLLDDNIPISAINPALLEEFIQVTKNFYYDHYYSDRFGRHLPRQIKNAEMVLVPKFLEGNSLGELAKFMIENDIDQVNTQETSKAANYDVLTFWDNEGVVTEENLKDFVDKAPKVKQAFSYMYLYKQQDVPQHMLDTKNKAGIQVMKKILDNQQPAMGTYVSNFVNAYVANIREDFDKLMDTYGIKFDKDYNIINVEGGAIDYSKVYKAALIEASRLGLDSNTIDYLTMEEGTNRTVMPSHMNMLSTKIESIAQSQFNKFITRQKLPGWHGAQVTSVGLEALIKKEKKLVDEECYVDMNGATVEVCDDYLDYLHKNENVPTTCAADILILKKNSYGKSTWEIKVLNTNRLIPTNNVDETYKLHHRKRIELGYHKDGNIVEILLPKWASTMFNQYDKKGELIKEVSIEDIDEDVLKCIGYRIPTEGKQSMAIMKVVGFLPEWMGSTVVVPDEWVTQTGSNFSIDSIYGIAYETYLGEDGRIHKVQYDEKTDETSTKKRYILYVNAKCATFNQKVVDFTQAELLADKASLISFDDFTKLSVENQNTRKARNNRIIDSMIAILESPSSLEESLSRSNYDDIIEANEELDKLDCIGKGIANVCNLIDQIQFHNTAMNSRLLRGLSINRDTANSVFNVVKAKLCVPIRVRYTKRIDLTVAAEAFPVKDGVVYHDCIGNSKNNKNVVGDYITVASSHTTSHILDAMKVGVIKNENKFTFNTFKTLFDIGCDAYTAMLWLRQPGISRIVEAYNESQSVFVKCYCNPIETAVKRIASDLNIKIRNEVVNDTSNIVEVLKALQKRYGVQFAKILPNSRICFDNEVNAEVFTIDVDRMEKRFHLQSLSNEVNEICLLLDLAMILNFNYLNKYAKAISTYIKVLNPDKFGAKQSRYATRQVLDDIKKLIDTGQANELIVGDTTLIESIYPCITKSFESGSFKSDVYLKGDANRSTYKILDAFLRNSTVPSIMINQGLLATQSDNFTEAIENLQHHIGGSMNEKLYNDFTKYVLGNIYLDNSSVISNVIKLGRNGILDVDTKATTDMLAEGRSPIREERRRVYGYSYPINFELDIVNPANPTAEEVIAFMKLTPAQKVHYVQQKLDATHSHVFQSLSVNMFNGQEYRNKGVSSQSITFDDQQQDLESLYRMFDSAFNNSNPLLRLTALDIIKYAFIVEGYQFRKSNVGKIIRNNALYTPIEHGGTEITGDIKQGVYEVSVSELAQNNIYEDFIRSHSKIRQILSYRVKYSKKGRNVSPVAYSGGMYKFYINNKQEFNIAKDMRILKEEVINDEMQIVLNTRYITIIDKEADNLFKAEFDGKILYLIPLNKLEENEHGTFSANMLNNKYFSKEYYYELIKESEQLNESFERLFEMKNRLFDAEVKESYKAKKVEGIEVDKAPSNPNFIIDLAATDTATKQLVSNINDKLNGNQITGIWFWNGSKRLKEAFSAIGAESIQVIPDNDGKPVEYIISRARTFNPNRVTNEAQFEGINRAKANGVVRTDELYLIRRRVQEAIISTEVTPEDVEH